jgi:hypothetical protein
MTHCLRRLHLIQSIQQIGGARQLGNRLFDSGQSFI